MAACYPANKNIIYSTVYRVRTSRVDNLCRTGCTLVQFMVEMEVYEGHICGKVWMIAREAYLIGFGSGGKKVAYLGTLGSASPHSICR